MDYSHQPLAIAYGKAYLASSNIGQPGGYPNYTVSVLMADRSETTTIGAERDTHIRRAVMCWNACLSLTETELTDMGVDGVARWMRNTTAVLGNAGRERDELAQRVKDLEAKRDELFAERDKAEREREELRAGWLKLQCDISELIPPVDGERANDPIIDRVRRLRQVLGVMSNALAQISLIEADSSTPSVDKVRTMARIARTALHGEV